jgi:hypothetical protein
MKPAFKSLALTITTLATLVAPTAMGAQFHKIERMSHPELQALAEHARKAVRDELFGNCGAVLKTKVTYRREGEPWLNSVKQMIWSSYTDSVVGTEITPRTARAALQTFDQFMADLKEMHPNRELEDELDAEEKALKMKRSLLNSVDDMVQWSAFSGSLEGAFSLGLIWFAVVDEDNQEMLMFGDGYCE